MTNVTIEFGSPSIIPNQCVVLPNSSILVDSSVKIPEGVGILNEELAENAG